MSKHDGGLLVADHPLASAMAEAGCSHSVLARRVNELAAHQGLVMRYDKASVTRWIQGKHPRGRAPEFIAAALSERLARHISPVDLGFATEPERPVAAQALAYREDVAATLHTLAELGSLDISRRSLLGTVPFVAGAVANTQRHWLLWLAELDDEAVPHLAAAADQGPVEPVHFMISTFDEMDNRYGGSHVRTAIIHYLTTEVIPMLQRHRLPEQQRRQLFTAAAKLAAMAGWCSYDSAEYGLAQRYMTQALRLCEQGRDKVLGGQICAGMSHLATNLGHPAEGVAFARMGLATAKHAGSPLGLMRLHLMAARGHAAEGRAKETATALSAAESAWESSRGPDHESPWVRYLDHHYLAAEAAHCFRDLGNAKQAEALAADSVLANGQRARRQAISQAVMATAHLQQRRLDQAIDAAGTALKWLGSGAVHSERSVQALRDFRARLEPHRSEPIVRRFEKQAQPLLGAA
ncbi:hypothetical protein [Actinacidiphila oryziradicis]|uniref:Transcriptional regulator n=1 Tax=Actinacidiphila oryziradicis TaxID=2571141 RepID=A0A4U0T6T6_9ACTN|nr:hypothetical protein [Actinacidiphila oryziradicis]TKA08575.1 hypothetical protein FCI23_26945 [Actinacidiphila oryziradicis]